MKIQKRRLDGTFEIAHESHADNRGFLVRLYDEQIFRDFGLETHWVQESYSHTDKKYTLRGLHVSLPPCIEGKCVVAVRGDMLWVIVDLRKDSATFGQWDSVVLSGNLHNILYVPRGFSHGCLSLTDDCDLLIRADNYFSDGHGAGIVWNDKELDINWRLNGNIPIISKRDEQYQTFGEFKEKYGGVV